MRITAIALASVLMLAGCSSGGSSTASSPSPAGTTASSAPATGPSSTGAGGATAGCAAQGAGVPAGAITRRPLDVDRDGRVDTLWAVEEGAGILAGITTASGATSRVRQEFAGGVEPFAFVADADQHGTIVILVGNNRGQSLYRWWGCHIRAVLNPEGRQYAFDAGFAGNGTGIGCLTVKGADHRDLVGLNLEGGNDDQTRVVKRTQIVIDGLRAHNGLVDRVRVQRGSQAEKSATTVSCGDLTPATDGVVLEGG